MQCANPLCQSESLCFRSRSLHVIDCSDQWGPGGNLGNRRRVIWLCAECSLHFVVEGWRPPGQQLQSRPLTAGCHDCRDAA